MAAAVAVQAALAAGTKNGKVRPWVKWLIGIVVFLLFSAGVMTYAVLSALASISFGSESLCAGGETDVQFADDAAALENIPDDAQVCVLTPPEHGPSAWGGYANGAIPLTALQELSWAHGHYLRPDAAAAAEAMNTAYKARFGVDMSVTDSYRDLAGQDAVAITKGSLAAKPGTSNHGWGLAVDWGGGVQNFGSAQHIWMQENAATYGWRHPGWAQQTGSKPEAWHWEYWGAASATGTAGTGGASDEARAIAQTLIGSYGWDGSQYTCLNSLWTKESGWRVDADNPSSSAYGIPQALPGSKMASAGADWETSATTQITWGLQYISERYGTPCKAWEHSQAMNWY